MNMNYTLMPTDWDETRMEEVQAKMAEGAFLPTQVDGVVSHCGSLGRLSKKEAIAYAEEVKAEYPFITFELMKGDRWGSLETIQTF
jgi:hypothetical protein